MKFFAELGKVFRNPAGIFLAAANLQIRPEHSLPLSLRLGEHYVEIAAMARELFSLPFSLPLATAKPKTVSAHLPSA